MRWIAQVCATLLAFCVPSVLSAQINQHSHTSVFLALDRFEDRAAELLANGQIEAYEAALRDALIYSSQTAEIPRYRTARLLVSMAGFLVDYRGDLQTAHFVLSQAIAILGNELGSAHIETLRAQAEWIYIKQIEIETEKSWRRAGRVPQFWDGTERDKIPSARDVEIMGAISRFERQNGTEYDAVSAAMNHVGILLRADRYNDALGILRTMLERRTQAQAAGAVPAPELDFMILQTLGSTFMSGGRYDMAATVFRDGVDEVLDLLRQNQWKSATGVGQDTHIEGQLYGQTYAMAAWRGAQGAPNDAQRGFIEMGFEAMQMAGYGPASAAVSRGLVHDKAQDPALATLAARWVSGASAGADLGQLRSDLNRRFPEFLAAQIPTPVPLAQVQRDIVGADEALITILPGTAQSGKAEAFNGLVIAVTREGARFAEISMSWDELVFDIMQLHHVLDPKGFAPNESSRAPLANVQGTASASRSSAAFEFKAAHRLYTAFFGAPEIADLIAPKQSWTLVPLGETLSVPFPALVIEDADRSLSSQRSAAQLRAVRWLGHERAVQVVPSVAALKILRERRNKRKAVTTAVSYVAFGDPAFSGQPDLGLPSVDGVMRGGTVDRAAALRALPRLPGTRREVAALAQVFDSASSLVFLGQNATEAQVGALNASGALRNIGVLHFATHGLLGGAFQGLAEPALALSPQVDGIDASDDGLLTASEAARLRIDADWVILSACDTAGNESISGDGLGGLVQGFFTAGARNLLVSHWRVDDLAAEQLITQTVTASREEGIGKAEALRLAMKGLAADTSRDGARVPNAHPSMWAPFLLIGGG